MKVGQKYCRYLEGSNYEIARVVKVKPGTVFFKIGDKKLKCGKDEFEKEFILLIEECSICFSVVELSENDNDVIISLYRKQEIESSDNVPYLICRQNILDFFTDQAEKVRLKTDDIPLHLGISVTKDNIPEDISMELTTICNNLIYSEALSIYKDDDIDSILGLLKERNLFDRTIKRIYDKVQGTNVYGVNSTVRELLVNTGFTRDLLSALNIIPVNFKIDHDTNGNISNEQFLMFQNYLNKRLDTCVIIKYDYHINLNKIQKDFILVKDNTSNIYVLAYESNGETILNDMQYAIQYSNNPDFNIEIG